MTHVSWQHQLHACIKCGLLIDDGHEQAPVRCGHCVGTKVRTGCIANNGSAQNLLCCNAFIAVMKSAELWNCNNLSNLQRLPRKRTLLAKT